jgi:hypothetical protein
VYAVGNNGIVMHFDGISWTEHATLNATALRAVWGSGPSNVLAVGAADPNQINAFRYNGSSWRTEDIGARTELNAIHGASSQSIIAVGLGGSGLGSSRDAFYHFEGDGWRRSTSDSFIHFFAVWAGSPSTAYVAGTGTLVYRATLK